MGAPHKYTRGGMGRIVMVRLATERIQFIDIGQE